jgi:hypothetical protein
MDLSIVNECLTDAMDDVSDSIDMMYVKQQTIMEFSDEINLSEMYDCFQEGYTKPSSSKELNVWNFDSSHIIKAIKYFNKAYAEIPFDKTNFDEIKKKQERGELDLRTTITPERMYPAELIKDIETRFRNNSGPLVKGFQELQKQFDCKFKIYISQKQGTGTNIPKFTNNPGKLTISKKKGFQLGGLDISINLHVGQLLSMVPADRKIFGQALTAILLHEIYHNIVHMVDIRNKKIHDDIKKSIGSAGEANNKISAISILSSFVDRFTSTFNLKQKEVDKDRSVNRLYVLSQIKNNPNAMKRFEEDVKHNNDKTRDSEIDEYIKELQIVDSILKLNKVSKMVSAACAVLLSAVGFAFGNTLAIAAGTVYLAIMSLSMLMKKVKSFLFVTKPQIQEEYFCDLFASMYKLPIHLSSFNRQIKLNQVNAEKMTKIRKLDQSLDKSIKDVHPLSFDREVTSYKVAKQILESKQKLKPEVKSYLKYIVDLHDGIDKIDNPYSKRQAKKLDPEAAKDLQKTLEDFVNKTGAVVTESVIYDIMSYGGGYYGS